MSSDPPPQRRAVDMTAAAQPVAAGWYPTGRPYRFRYFDGKQWAPGTVKIKKVNHWLHATASLLTCGLWAPFWWVIAMSRTKDGMPVGGFADAS